MDLNHDSGVVTGISEITPAGSTVKITGAGGIILPTGNTAQRLSPPIAGALRFNSELNKTEYWNGIGWNTDMTNLDDCNDVSITSPLNKQVLQYNGTTWVNKTINMPTLIQIYTSVIPPRSGTTYKVTNNSVPLITDGTQIWSYSITPTITNSKIIITGSAYVDHSTNGRNIAFAIFRNSTCIGVACSYVKGMVLPMHIVDTSPSTSTITYSIRCFSDGTGTWYVGQGNIPIYGGMLASHGMTLQEIT